MTIKNRKKNVSAENKKVLTDINLQNTVLNVDEDNFWDESQILKNIILPEASSTKEFGLMSKEDYNNIQYAFNKLNALEDDTGEYLGINFDTLADLRDFEENGTAPTPEGKYDAQIQSDSVNYVFEVGEQAIIPFKLVNNSGNGIPNEDVQITINDDEIYTRITDLSGICNFELEKESGTYYITVSFLGNQNYLPCEQVFVATFNEVKIESIIIININESGFSISLVSVDDVHIANRIIKCTINNEERILTTNDDGETPLIEVTETSKISVKFDGDNIYQPASLTTVINR